MNSGKGKIFFTNFTRVILAFGICIFIAQSPIWFGRGSGTDMMWGDEILALFTYPIAFILYLIFIYRQSEWLDDSQIKSWSLFWNGFVLYSPIVIPVFFFIGNYGYKKIVYNKAEGVATKVEYNQVEIQLDKGDRIMNTLLSEDTLYFDVCFWREDIQYCDNYFFYDGRIKEIIEHYQDHTLNETSMLEEEQWVLMEEQEEPLITEENEIKKKTNDPGSLNVNNQYQLIYLEKDIILIDEGGEELQNLSGYRLAAHSFPKNRPGKSNYSSSTHYLSNTSDQAVSLVKPKYYSKFSDKTDNSLYLARLSPISTKVYKFVRPNTNIIGAFLINYQILLVTQDGRFLTLKT